MSKEKGKLNGKPSKRSNPNPLPEKKTQKNKLNKDQSLDKTKAVVPRTSFWKKSVKKLNENKPSMKNNTQDNKDNNLTTTRSSNGVEKVVKKLAHLYCEDVLVHSPYHIQVKSEKGPHDIWVKKDGEIKFKRAGSAKVYNNSNIKSIVDMIGSNKRTTIDKMKEMLDVAKIIGDSEKAGKILGDSIFTDAGFKDGRARIAAVLTRGDEIIAKSMKGVEKYLEIKTIQDAERAAINYGLEMDPNLTVYNDNKPVCDSLNNPRVKWLSREHLAAPDKIASMKGR